MREDKVSDGNKRAEVLSNAYRTEDEYFIAPPGNIPLVPRNDLLHENEMFGESTKDDDTKNN